MLIVRVIVIFIGYRLDNVLLTIIMFSFSSAIMWFGFLLWAAKQSNSSIFFVIKTFIKRMLLTLILTIPLILVSVLSVKPLIWWGGLIISAIFLAIYIVNDIKKEY